MKLKLWFFLVCLSGAAWSHEIKLEAMPQTAQVVRLTYADGQPFAFAAYELYLPGQAVPEQVGRTNSRGQVVFVPAAQTEWRLKAYSADGHGMDQIITVTARSSEGETPNSNAIPRLWWLISGLSMVFGLFGLGQLFLRKKSS